MALTDSEYRLIHNQILNNPDRFSNVSETENGRKKVSFGRRNRVLKRRGIDWQELRQKAREMNRAEGEVIDKGKHHLVIEPDNEGPNRVYVDRKLAERLPREKNVDYNFMRSGYRTEDSEPLFRVLPVKRYREVEVRIPLISGPNQLSEFGFFQDDQLQAGHREQE